MSDNTIDAACDVTDNLLGAWDSVRDKGNDQIQRRSDPRRTSIGDASDPIQLDSSSDEEKDRKKSKRKGERKKTEKKRTPFLSRAEAIAALKDSDSDSSSSDVQVVVALDDSSNDEFCREDQEEEDEALDFLKCHCWKCRVWIQHPDSSSKSSEICYYALHSHPLLEVPVCIVCAEKIEATEHERTRNAPDPQSDTKETTPKACSGCAKDDCFVWECRLCQRAMCATCIAQAYLGAGADGGADLEGLTHVSEQEWKCFCSPCILGRGAKDQDETITQTTTITPVSNQKRYMDANFPPLLAKLQKETSDIFSLSETTKKYHQTLEDALEDLQLVEAEKRSCELKLEDPETLTTIIRADLKGKHEARSSVDKRRLKREVAKAFQEWVDHQARLEDRISILGDRLKSVYDIESRAVFRFFEDQKATPKKKSDNSSDDDESDDEPEEPAWKRAADQANAKRERATRKEHRKRESLESHPRYRLVLTDDAEDLGSGSSSEDGHSNDEDSDEDSMTLGWRHMPRPQKEEIEDAQKEEDSRRVREGKAKLIVRNKDIDEEERRGWNAGLKVPAFLDASRKTRKRRLPTRTISVSNESHNPDTIAMDETGNDTSPAFRRRKRRRKRSKSSAETSRNGFVDGPVDHTAVHTLIATPKGGGGFRPSSLILSREPLITVDERIERHLKEHQREGIRFMYRNAFCDLGVVHDEGDASDTKNSSHGGCILAHSMGLGKSLSCVALLHAVMAQPALAGPGTSQRKIHKVILVVPVNTIVNWENEFQKWTKGLQNKLAIFNVSNAEPYRRPSLVEQWSNWGGILLTSDALFRNMAKIEKTERLIKDTDAIVLDESHTMLKNKDSLVYKAFMKIQTKRRICLTGTPFQNNLFEYYRMISFIRPNLFGDSERKFQREYVDPIQAGMGTDAADEVKLAADQKLERFFETLRPYVHRRDSSLLCKDLPSLQQVCLHVRPTKLQRALYRAYREHRTATNDNNFLKQFVNLRPIHNHPATLLCKATRTNTSNVGSNDSKHASTKTHDDSKRNYSEASTSLTRVTLTSAPAQDNLKTESVGDANETAINGDKERVKEKSGRDSPDSIIEILSSDEEDNGDDGYESQDISTSNSEWWTNVAKRFGIERMKDVENGNKCIVLLHILSHAKLLGEKTVVFSQSLKTLDFLSQVLASKDWQDLCPSLKDSFPGLSMGGWIQGEDFLRIDGATSGFERGELLKDFSDHKSLQLFLISSKAGGIGINLVSANRVVLFDSHFNPTIDLQAIYRCYRYGQERNVFAYRFLTQGSMEEKVYSRAVTKIGLGNRVIDGKELHRCFRKDELESLASEDDWVECTRCKKWRMFPPNHTADITNLPDDWICEMMDKYDRRMNVTCEFPEKDVVWYYDHFKKPNEMIVGSGKPNCLSLTTGGEFTNKISEAESEKLLERDEVLQNVLSISSKSKHACGIVSKHYFSDVLLSDANASDATSKTTIKDDTTVINI